MKRELFDNLRVICSPLITSIFKDNIDFYDSNTIKEWRFMQLNDVSIVAHCSRTSNCIFINIESVKKAIEEDDIKTIEYFILHEVRHSYQHEIVKAYKNGKQDLPVDSETIKKWIKESENYVKAIDDSGCENEDYFFQNIEIDAYAYAFAVMKYKYNLGKFDLYVPPVYSNEFDKLVECFMEQFQNKGIKQNFVAPTDFYEEIKAALLNKIS